jgi:hypothetical protein
MTLDDGGQRALHRRYRSDELGHPGEDRAQAPIDLATGGTGGVYHPSITA